MKVLAMSDGEHSRSIHCSMYGMANCKRQTRPDCWGFVDDRFIVSSTGCVLKALALFRASEAGRAIGLYDDAFREHVVAIFHEHHPQVSVTIEFRNRLLDLVGEGLDLPVRTGVLADSRLIGMRIARAAARAATAALRW